MLISVLAIMFLGINDHAVFGVVVVKLSLETMCHIIQSRIKIL